MNEEDLHLTTKKLMKHLESVATIALDFVQSDEFIDAYKKIFTDAFQPIDKIARPPLSGSSQEALKMRRDVHEYVIREIKKEIKTTVEVECLDKLFRELHEMKVNSQFSENMRTAWRPPGNAEQHMTPFQVFVKLELKKKLQCQFTVEREKLNIIKSKIETLRNKLNTYDKSITQSKADLHDEILHRVNMLSMP